jgi:hypothetical protein
MPILSRSLPLIAAASVIALAGCNYPTDQSAGMYVSVSAPHPVLLRGSVTDLAARVWLRRGAGDSVEVHNAELIWSTSDPQLATVSSGGAAIGRVTGVNSGIVEVRAIARGYESAEPGIFYLRVANPLEIDSISPDTVRYGQLVIAYGVGVGNLFFAGLGNGTLGIDSTAVMGDPQGIGARAFWVAYPASTGHLFAAGSGQLVAAPESTVVLPYDIYEPNELTPAVIALDGPPQYAGAPGLRFYNPALAFEDMKGATFGFDWYRWTTADPSKAYTFIFFGPALGRTHQTYLTDDASTTTAASWRLGPGMYDCKGQQFRPPVAQADSVFIALGRLPAGSVDLVSAYAQQGRYGLAVLQSYQVLDPQIPADRFEENDLCLFADSNFADPARRIDLGTSFAENLTIDLPHDIDWLRFRVSGVLPQFVTVRTVAYTFGKPDRTDIDTYVLRVPVDSRGLESVGGDAGTGSTSSSTMLLGSGDYYLAVVDSAGVPTHYGVCIAAGSSCTLPSAPIVPAASVSSRPPLTALPMRTQWRTAPSPRAPRALPWR